MRSEIYQRELLALSFDLTPPAQLAEFALYRDMIRARLFAMARVAYLRVWTLLGSSACDAGFACYLAAEPPRSPLVREVIAGFAEYACADRALAQAAPFARDLLRFEAEVWRVSDAVESAPPVSLREVDFDGVPVLNPTLRLVRLSHAIGDVDAPPAECASYVLLIYRRAQDDDVRWYAATAFFAELLALASRPERSLAELVHAVLAARGEAPSEDLLAELASALTVAVERGVLLGVVSAA